MHPLEKIERRRLVKSKRGRLVIEGKKKKGKTSQEVVNHYIPIHRERNINASMCGEGGSTVSREKGKNPPVGENGIKRLWYI